MVISAFLVEDRPELRATLVESMEEVAPMKFIGHADTEDAARQWLTDHDGAWDLAIVDLFLGEGTGFGVLQDCLGRKPNQKVVVFTSHRQENILNRCLELGADQVFDKSRDVEKLVRYCERHAEQLGNQYGQLQ